MSVFTRSLPAAYRVLGDAATYTPAGGGAGLAVRVIFDAQGGAGGFDDLLQVDGPTIRVQAADVSGTVDANSTFAIGANTWRARERAVPLFDAAELVVPVARV